MSHEFIGRIDALELHDGLFCPVVVLRPVHLEHAADCDAKQRALGGVGMAGAVGVQKAAFVVIRVALLVCRAVHDVVRFLQR